VKLALLVLAAGCNHYTPGSFHAVDRWPGTHVALPCLDVAVDAHFKPEIVGPVVTYSLGNRCEHDVTLDLQAAHVFVRDTNGRDETLALFDPRHEIHTLVVPARVQGRERLGYIAPHVDAGFAQVCVDVGAIERGAPAREQWACAAMEVEP
jgi:hypothetical protein